ncbi:MAG: alpha/beta hydrolase [Paludibacter sp.]|nr:alpha/beta hydrolase [Paludibacter sp.]
MTNYFIVPGLGGSGTGHWQTYFENTQENFRRVTQKDWDSPLISEWVEELDNAIAEFDSETLVLVAHSLGCLTVAEWANKYKRKIKGAMLVAPPDINVLENHLNKKLFERLPTAKLNFKSILVASTNDPWASIDRAKQYAEAWGSDFVNIGNAGHINNLSGYGEWNEGLEILKILG